MSLDNIGLRSNDSFVRVSCVRSFVSCIVHFSYRSCETFVRFSLVSFAFFLRLRLVRIVNLYDPGSVVIDTLNIQMHDSSISWLELGLGMVL